MRRRWTARDTSLAAYRDWLAYSPVADAKILRALSNAPMGLADVEIEQLTGLRQSTVSGNRSHLVDDGLVYDSGARRKIGRNFRIVWKYGPDPLGVVAEDDGQLRIGGLG